MDILDIKDYGPENNRNYRCILVIIDNVSQFGWTVPLKKNSQTIKDSFENIITSSKRKPNLFEIDRCKEFSNINFQKILSKKINFFLETHPQELFLQKFSIVL